jgi:uncharacterized protein
MWGGLFVVLGGLAVQGRAVAASFDCGHATSPREAFICGDATLSALDRQLGDAYRAHRALLSSQGAALLQRSERSWLRFVTTTCPLAASDVARRRGFPKACLVKSYQERLRQVAMAGARVGPFVFNRVDIFRAQPVSDDGSGERPGFLVQHVAYPQIDAPRSPAEEAWNTENSKALGAADDGDYDLDYEIGLANARVVSVQWNNWFYSHGVPHGMGGSKAQDLVLGPVLRALTAQDVFGPGSGWVRGLQVLFWDALRKAGWQPPGNQEAGVKGEIESEVVQPEHWFFTAEGLEVAFSAYDGGCYVCTPQPVTVTWAALAPLLARDSVVP